MMLQVVLNHLKKYNYFKIKGKNVAECYLYGPVGELLAENIRREWLLNVSTYREKNVFPFHFEGESVQLSKEYYDAFLMAKELNNSQLPYGLIESRREVVNYTNFDPSSPRKCMLMRYLGFFKPSEAEQFYYRWQLHRKRWWRKFSTDPGKFSLTASEKLKNGVNEEAKILAKFPWGDHNVETISLHGQNYLKYFPKSSKSHCFFTDGKEKYFAYLVESTCSLDYATFTYLCDGYAENSDENRDPIMRLHKKLAPYKFTAAASVTSSDKIHQLLDMSHLILLELRQAGVSCLLPVTPPFGVTNLKDQLEKSNALAVPYTVVLTEDSLHTGIFSLYSRDTTIQEQVHVSKIKDYGQILMEA